MKSLLVFALFISFTLARPQNVPTQPPNNRNPFLRQQRPGDQGNTNQVFATTTVAPNTPTTASPGYLNCLQTCPSTTEYNPICGSDNLNYHNNGRLACAQRCGKTVAAVRAGTCRPL